MARRTRRTRRRRLIGLTVLGIVAIGFVFNVLQDLARGEVGVLISVMIAVAGAVAVFRLGRSRGARAQALRPGAPSVQSPQPPVRQARGQAQPASPRRPAVTRRAGHGPRVARDLARLFLSR